MSPTDEQEKVIAHGEPLAGRKLVKPSPFNAEASPHALRRPLTLTGHFVRSHFAKPALGPDHRLALAGAVASPQSLDMATLRREGTRTWTVTLECAGNSRTGMTPTPPGEPWGGGAVSTAMWTGVPLATVLARCGLRDDVCEILAVGADQGQPEGADTHVPFARSLSLDKALAEGPLLAFEMNGLPLLAEHGGPLRLVVPGWYGVASVKWLARLEALTVPFEGFFQRERYVYRDAEGRVEGPVSDMRVNAVITEPAQGAELPPGRLMARGWAWSGHGEISHVDLSLDAGPWRPAQLDLPLGPWAWRGFSASLSVPAAGRHTLRARATDQAGRVQPERAPWNALGYANNAVPLQVFDVR